MRRCGVCGGVLPNKQRWQLNCDICSKWASRMFHKLAKTQTDEIRPIAEEVRDV